MYSYFKFKLIVCWFPGDHMTTPIWQQSLFEWRLQLVRRIPHQTHIGGGEKDPDIRGMSYNSARDELFLADWNNNVVRALHLRDSADEMRDVYKTPHGASPIVWCVCQLSDSDTLLVCLEEKGPDKKLAYWLVALSRNGSEWRETQRMQTEGLGWICCALSDSRVLIGQWLSTFMELFRVESGPRIERVHRLDVPEEYDWFSATCGSDTLVAMTYPYTDQSVRVYRQSGHRLEELTRIDMKNPKSVMWLADRLLVADWDDEKESHAVIELKLSGTRIERRRELIANTENIGVGRWCAVNEGLAIFDYKSKETLHYSFRN